MYGWDLHSHRRFLLFPSPLFLLIFSRSLASHREGLLPSRCTRHPFRSNKIWESLSPIHSSDMSFFIEKRAGFIEHSLRADEIKLWLTPSVLIRVYLSSARRLHWTQRLEILTAWTARWRNVCFCTTWYCVPWQRQRAKFLSHLQVPVHEASSKIIHDIKQPR